MTQIKKHTQQNEFDIIKWKGIKDCGTKKTTGGYLFIKFNKDVTLARVNPNSIPLTKDKYKAGQTIGFSIKQQTKKNQ